LACFIYAVHAVKGPEPDAGGGASDALRSAIEKTFAATAGSAVETRERAGELLDDVARRGQEARDEVARRGQEAQRGVSERISSALQRLRGAEVGRLQREVEALRKRIAELEQQLRSKSELKG
jgi:polyhydroxyalkanoate synthesis regulator phasin